MPQVSYSIGGRLSKSGPQRLVSLNAWSPVDGTVREGLESMTLGKVRQWGVGSGLVNAHTIPSVSVSVLCLWIKCILSGTSARLSAYYHPSHDDEL